MAVKRTTTVVDIAASGDTEFDILTNDENLTRTLLGVFAGISTPDVVLTITMNSNPQLSVDCSEFSSTKGLIECSIAFAVNVRIHGKFTNNTGSAITATPVNIAYMV